MLWFWLGSCLGFTLGVLIAALCQASHREDEVMARLWPEQESHHGQ